MTRPVPAGDPASCGAAAADLAACARWLRDASRGDPASVELVAHVERLRAALAELGVALSRAQSVLPAGAGPDRVRNSAVSQLGRARARLRRTCVSISTDLAEPVAPGLAAAPAPSDPPGPDRSTDDRFRRTE